MNTKIKKALSLDDLAFAGLFALYSCADKWEDHYETVQGETYQGTLFDYLESQSEQLSDFAEILKAVGYDYNLSSDQMFTVWAPVNGSFDKEALLTMIENGDKERVIERFVQNHVALYSISLSPNAQDVTLQNSKVIKLSTAAEAKFGDCEIVKSNVACKNGVFNIIAAENIYVPTIYEIMEDDFKEYLLANPDLNPKEVVSMMSFLDAYNADSLDESKSVFLGLDMSGNRVYIDSVMIRNNTILKMLDALVYEEDSTYWTIVPTVEAYQQRYEEAKKFLVYNPSVNAVSPIMADSLQNRYANLFAMRDLFYNINANEYYTDSLKSTDYSLRSWKEHVYRGDPFGSEGILANAEVVECSNGNIYKVNEYPFSIYDQFFKEIPVSLNNYLVDNTPGNTKNCTMDPVPTGRAIHMDETGKVWNLDYLHLIPSTNLVQPQVTFKITGTLSGTYDLKLVTLSPRFLIQGTMNEEEVAAYDKLYKFRVNLFQRNDKGEMPAKATTLYVPGTKTRDFESHPLTELATPYDTIDICPITLDHCYYGRDEAGIMVQLVTNVSSSLLKNGYSREMLLHKILLVPHVEEEESGE
jgi:hypothetical protein